MNASLSPPKWPGKDEDGMRKLHPVMTSKLLITASVHQLQDHRGGEISVFYEWGWYYGEHLLFKSELGGLMAHDGVLSILDVDRQGRPGPYYKYYNCSW